MENSSTLARRPVVLTVNSLRWSLATGAPPIVPSAAGVFCALMAAATSAGVRLNAASRAGSSQTRSE